MKYLPILGFTVALVSVADIAVAKTPAEIESIAKVVMMKMTIAFQDDKQKDRVLERFDRAITLNHDDTKDTLLLAECNRAIALNPKDVNAYTVRGFLKLKKPNGTKGALADFNRAISLNPQYSFAYVGRGYIKYTRLGSRAGGIADTRRAAKLSRAQRNDLVLVYALELLQSWGVGE